MVPVPAFVNEPDSAFVAIAKILFVLTVNTPFTVIAPLAVLVLAIVPLVKVRLSYVPALTLWLRSPLYDTVEPVAHVPNVKVEFD